MIEDLKKLLPREKEAKLEVEVYNPSAYLAMGKKEKRKSHVKMIIPPHPCAKCGRLASIMFPSGRWYCNKCFND